MNITYNEKLAKFCSDVNFSNLPPAVIDRVKYFFLDYLGIALRASRIDSSQPIHDFIKASEAPGRATVIGEQQSTNPFWAALANGTAAHSLELDDTFLEGSVHNECFLYSTALAMAEDIGANGKSFIEAIVVGFDVACRLAKALQPAVTNERGFHPTGTCGALGSAVTAGKLLQLNCHQFISAIGIAASQASGLLEYVTDGSWTKRFHAGWAAHAGLVAANIAKHGFTGPKTAIEGKFGFLHAYSGDPILEGIVSDLGKDYKILQTSIKFYPCNYYIQAANDAMLEIIMNNDFSPEQVKSIKVYTLSAGFNLACLPIEKKRNPQSTLDAQFSMHFNVAIALLKKQVTLSEYTKEMFFSSEVHQLMEKISCEIDPALDAQYPKAWPARITTTLHDGRTFTAEIKFPKGDPRNPLSWDELIIKHKSIVYDILEPSDDEQLIDFVFTLEKQSNFTNLSKLLKKTNTGQTQWQKHKILC